MPTCTICNSNLEPMNKPTFGFGKLMDGNELCLDCYKKISNKDLQTANNLSYYSRERVLNIITSVSNFDLQ